MPRWLSFAIFIVVSLTVIGGVHYYLWARLVRDLELATIWHRVLTGTSVALFASIPLTFFLHRSLPRGWDKIVAMPGYIWMGFLFLLLLLVLGVDIGRGVVRIVTAFFEDLPPVDPDKRLTITRALGGAVALVAGGAGAAAVRSALSPVEVKEVQVRLDRLPESLSGTTIVQLSDVHVGPTLGREFIEHIVERANALEPDVVAITGDLVDGSVRRLRDQVAALANLRAKYGVFFVTGNHEYYSGVDSWCAELERLGIRVLRNERVSIGTGGASFDLAGVDDYNARRFGRGHGPDLPRALEGRDDSRELVLLAHQPRAIHEAERYGVGLQLSGHTHGGQLFPWNLFVKLQQPVVSGLARIGRSLIYVSNGTGYWGPPMRLGAPAEVTKVVLTSV